MLKWVEKGRKYKVGVDKIDRKWIENGVEKGRKWIENKVEKGRK